MEQMKFGKKPVFNKKNPWKNWPDDLPCFCGSGRTPRARCPCKILMPEYITTEDYKEAQKDMEQVLAYVIILKKEGKTYRDLPRAKKLHSIFIERDRGFVNEKERAIRKAIAKLDVGRVTPGYYDNWEKGPNDAPGELPSKDSGSDPDRST